eukprot:6576042-Pyramimonas_sp.AAC.1
MSHTLLRGCLFQLKSSCGQAVKHISMRPHALARAECEIAAIACHSYTWQGSYTSSRRYQGSRFAADFQ